MIRRLDTWRSVLIMALLLLGMVAATESRPSLMREDLNFVHPLEYGTALNEVTLQAAVGAIGSDEKILLLTPGRWTISSDLTIPLNVTMLVSAGATLEVTGGSTLTINGQLDAPSRPLFHGTGTVVLGPRIGERRAEWWGVVCDGATDSTAGLQGFFGPGGDLELPRGTCRFTRRPEISNNVG